MYPSTNSSATRSYFSCDASIFSLFSAIRRCTVASCALSSASTSRSAVSSCFASYWKQQRLIHDLKNWIPKPVCKKKVDGQVFLLLSSKSRQVSLDRAVLQTGRQFRVKRQERALPAEQGLFQTSCPVWKPVRDSVTCLLTLSEKVCPENPV